MSAGQETRVLTIVRRFAAARPQVWRAWTDPTVMVRWMHPHGVRTVEGSVEADVRIGGRYRFTMVDGDGTTYPSGGEYLELREPELLRCTWGAPDEPHSELSVQLTRIAPRETQMTFRLIGLPDDTGRMDSVWDGWREAIAELGMEIEGNGHG